MSKKPYTYRTATYHFKENIDQVFMAFTSEKILKKSGITFYSKIIKAHPQNNQEIIRIEMQNPITCTFDLQEEEIIDQKDYKSIIILIKKLNGVEVKTNLKIKTIFLANTSENSTLLIMETECEDPKDFYFLEYQKAVQPEKKMMFCFLIDKFLQTWKRPTIQIDSIVIQRSVRQIFLLISNFEEFLNHFYDKENYDIKKIGLPGKVGTEYYINRKYSEMTVKYTIKVIRSMSSGIFLQVSRENEENSKIFNKKLISFSIIKLSPVTSYVMIENKIPYKVKEKYIISLSHLYQKFLEDFRNKAEHTTCLCE